EASLEWYAQAYRVLRPLHEKDKQFELARRYLRNTHLGRAKALDALGRPSAAVPDWEQTVLLSPEKEGTFYRLQLAESLARNNDHNRVFTLINELTADKTTTGEVFYQLACLCGRAAGRLPEKQSMREEYGARGVALLGRAQAAGLFKNPARVEQLLKEESLVPLHSRADFQKLIGEINPVPPPT